MRTHHPTLCHNLCNTDKEALGTNTFPDLNNKDATTGRITNVTINEITRLEITVTGIALKYSPIIPLSQKYKGANTIIVVSVQKITGFPYTRKENPIAFHISPTYSCNHVTIP